MTAGLTTALKIAVNLKSSNTIKIDYLEQRMRYSRISVLRRPLSLDRWLDRPRTPNSPSAASRSWYPSRPADRMTWWRACLGPRLSANCGDSPWSSTIAAAAEAISAPRRWPVHRPMATTLLLTAPGPLVVNQSLYSKLSFNPDTGFHSDRLDRIGTDRAGGESRCEGYDGVRTDRAGQGVAGQAQFRIVGSSVRPIILPANC